MKGVFQSSNKLLKYKGNEAVGQVSSQANINKVIDEIIDDILHGNNRGSVCIDRERTVNKMEKLREMISK